jgi:hypothetical protein
VRLAGDRLPPVNGIGPGGLPAGPLRASAEWVMPETVSGPLLPLPDGPGWRPRSSSPPETNSGACLDSGTKRTSSPWPRRRTSPVRAVMVSAGAGCRVAAKCVSLRDKGAVPIRPASRPLLGRAGRVVPRRW